MIDNNLAKTLAAQEWWEWRRGIVVVEPEYGNTRFMVMDTDETYCHGFTLTSPPAWYRVRWENMPKRVIDLTDWATIGILIGWVCDLQPHYELHAHGAVDCGEAVARQLLTLMNWEG